MVLEEKVQKILEEHHIVPEEGTLKLVLKSDMNIKEISCIGSYKEDLSKRFGWKLTFY